MIKKFIAIAIVGGLLISILKEYVLIVLAIIVVLFLIRICADIFWWGRDNKKW